MKLLIITIFFMAMPCFSKDQLPKQESIIPIKSNYKISNRMKFSLNEVKFKSSSSTLTSTTTQKDLSITTIGYDFLISKFIADNKSFGIGIDFDLAFSNDFFNNTGIDKMNNLFLWLHRKSGAVEDLSGSIDNYVTQIDSWTSQNDDVFSINNTTFTVNTGNSPAVNFSEFQLDLNTTSATSYKVEIFKDGTSVYSETEDLYSSKLIECIFPELGFSAFCCNGCSSRKP